MFRCRKNLQEKNFMRLNLAPIFEYLEELRINEIENWMVPLFHSHLNKKRRNLKTLELGFVNLQDLDRNERSQLFGAFTRVKRLKIYFIEFTTREEVTDFTHFVLSYYPTFEYLEIGNLESTVKKVDFRVKEEDRPFFISGRVILLKIAHFMGIWDQTNYRSNRKKEFLSTHGEAAYEKYPLFVYLKSCRYCGVSRHDIGSFLVNNEEVVFQCLNSKEEHFSRLYCEYYPDTSLRVCSRCKSTYYCSEDCQRRDWKERHKKNCKPMKDKKCLKVGEEELEYIFRGDMIIDNPKCFFEQIFKQIQFKCDACGELSNPTVEIADCVNKFGMQSVLTVLCCDSCGAKTVVPTE